MCTCVGNCEGVTGGSTAGKCCLWRDSGIGLNISADLIILDQIRSEADVHTGLLSCPNIYKNPPCFRLWGMPGTRHLKQSEGILAFSVHLWHRMWVVCSVTFGD